MPDPNLTGLTEQSFERFVPFLPLSKEDQTLHQVWGWASIEEPDRAGEIMDYATSKPYFDKWSEAAKARTNGKSLGNIREMHQPIAAGKAIHLKAEDSKLGFYLGVQIDDMSTWAKIDSGTLAGFSVGGKYVKRWMDQVNGATLLRYTAEPNEISVVDVPSVPHATYTLVKMDGTTSQVTFPPGKLPTERILLYKADDVSTAEEPIEPPEVLIAISGHTTLSSIVKGVVDHVLGTGLTKGAFPTPLNQKVEGQTVQVYPTTGTPQTLTAGAPPTGDRLRQNHPPTETMTPPTASSSIRKRADGTLWPVLAKEVGDAPNLRHCDEGSRIKCGECKSFRWLGDAYCRKYDFPTAYDWTCDSFAIQDGTGEPDSQVHGVPAIAAAAPVGDLAKASNKCPNCGADIAVEKAGDLKCAKCGKMCKATADGAGYKMAKTPDATDADDVTKLAAVIGIAQKDFIGLTGYYFLKAASQPPGPPPGYPPHRSDYADPVNWSWPCDASRVKAVVGRYNLGAGIQKYSPREQAILGRRIARLGSRFQDQYVYDPRKKLIERVDSHQEASQ